MIISFLILNIINNPMKNFRNIMYLLIAVLLLQACNSKTEKSTDAEAQAGNEAVLSPTEKKALLEKERTDRQEKRRIALEELFATTPTYTDPAGNLVYHKAEISPSYAGGNKAMMEFLRDNLKFPEEAQEKGVEGTVFVDFVVSKNGTVREVEVTDATFTNVDQSFRDEAVRVVKSMPTWIPGNQNGTVVDVKFSIPITFEL
jgi:TonB family protein